MKKSHALSLPQKSRSRLFLNFILGISVFCSAFTPAFAQENSSQEPLTLSEIQKIKIKPVILHHLGGSNSDQSFGQAVYLGAKKFKEDFGVTFRDFEPQNDAQLEQAVQRFVREGYSPIIAAGFTYETIINKIAPTAPNTKFVIIDAVVKRPNVQSIIFKEHEGSFLVVVLAAQASKSGTIGFIGGMDTPFIRKFSCGYLQGARYINKDIRVFENMVGSTPSAWNDPVKGAELARSQMDRGADIIYHAAGASGVGILRAISDAKKLGIGVDSNQNWMFPGFVLTSMLKRVDRATYNTLLAASNDSWQGGIVELGVKENGLGWALDEHNQPLITPLMKETIDQAQSQILDGNLKVHNFLNTNSCPEVLTPTMSHEGS